jgi:hypothetical protein
MNRTFSTRLADWHEQAEGTKAVNIITIIQKLDKQLLKGTFYHYEYLSEICHPNSLGHNLMFGNLDHTTAIVALSDVAALDRAHFDHIFAAFFLVNLVEKFLQQIDRLLPRVRQLSEAAKKQQG